VQYRGSPDMLQALLSGDINISITGILPYATYVPSGKLYALASTGTKRVLLMPAAPTVVELGYPTVEFRNWFALFAPAGTPSPIVATLRAEVTKALSDPDLRKHLLAADLEPSAGTPAQIGELIKRDRSHWAQIIKSTGIKLVGE
jgi:tripartite-type tricarboxylate transporter receptor subunit TctC